jgi:catechol-2,3-dioxygenase
MQGIKLDHSVIKVTNWEQSNQFYSSVIGAEIIASGERIKASAAVATSSLHLESRPKKLSGILET